MPLPSRLFRLGSILVTLSLSLVLLVAGVGVSNTASAQESARDQALALFLRAEEHFRNGEEERAVLLLREAIDLHDAPPMHFNLARALRQTGDREGARQEFETFINMDPDSERAPDARERIRELDEEIEREDREAEREAVQLTEIGQGQVTEPAREPAVPPHAGPSPLPFVVTGVGAAAVGVGVVFGVLFDSEVSAAREAEDQQQAEVHQNQADSYAAIANALLIGGAVLALVGATWLVVELVSSTENPESASVSLELGPHPQLRGRF